MGKIEHADDARKDSFARTLQAGGGEDRFRQSGHHRTPADGRFRGGAGASLRPRVAGSAVDGHGGRVCAGLRRTVGGQFACGPWPRERDGHVVRRTTGRRADHCDCWAARAALQLHRTLALGRSAADRAPFRKMVGGSAPTGRSAARHPPCRQNRFGTANGAGVPIVAGRYPDR